MEKNLQVNDNFQKSERENIPTELKIVGKKQMIPEKVWVKRNRSKLRNMKGKIRISKGTVECEEPFLQSSVGRRV